jgi:uncharacterized DUF497 family protein
VKFIWDPNKAEENLKSHGVDFREAATIFDDPLSTTFPDTDHSVGERRFLIIGMSAPGRILVVSNTETGDTIRIINDFMKKRNRVFVDDMRPEYDFASMKGGVRGKYARRARARTNIVLIEPDVADAFPTEKAVNEALKGVLNTTRAVRSTGGLPNKALQPTSRAPRKAKSRKRSRAVRG